MKTWLKIILCIFGFVLSFLFDYGVASLLFSMNKGNIALSMAGIPEILYIFLLLYLLSRDEKANKEE